jgi:CheY-like chemotaxis protein
MSELKAIVRVLIVEDEPLQRKIITEQLRRLNFVCEAAASGAEAFEILQIKDFDVVLLDLQLGDVSGLSLLPRIKKMEDAPGSYHSHRR